MAHFIKFFLACVGLLLCVSGCIPEDYGDCSSSDEDGISVTIGLDTPGTNNGQETQMP